MYRAVCLSTLAWLGTCGIEAAEFHGQVNFNSLPVPGAVVTASRPGQISTAVTDLQGYYSFSDLADGRWTVEVEMSGFETLKREIIAGPNGPPEAWELKMLPLDRMQAIIRNLATPVAEPVMEVRNKETVAAPPSSDSLSEQATDGYLINGSTRNGAASPFAQLAAFGNNRNGAKGLYNGGLGWILGDSALDARPYSLTGLNTAKSAYSRITGVAALGGPIRIPHLLKNGPNFFVMYQWTRDSEATAQPALLPDLTTRNGVFNRPILDPTTGQPFPGNTIPGGRISPQARSLLAFYPLPNFTAGAGYNYQAPLLRATHQDSLQSRLNKNIGRRDEIYGRFAFESRRSDAPSLFGFLDTSRLLGINTSVNWSHRLSQQWFLNAGYQFSRLSTRITPYFANRLDVSGDAGILGNSRDPANWGPPTLNFASGIAGLSDAQNAFDRNQTSGVSYSMLWNHASHNVMFGTEFRRQQFNYLSQQDPRGTFTFTGGVTGSDFADFLLGVPDTSSIAFGNPDKYFRASAYDAFMTDDWRIKPEFTLNAGLRWEYGAPITELYGRLVNLDVAPGFAAVSPVVAADPRGTLTGQAYPSSLVRPDKHGFEPRIGFAWRPVSGSSTVIRAGYGIYRDTSVYQTIAARMAQQPPLSKSLTVPNSPVNPLTLANGFLGSPLVTGNTFAIDPNFRAGYAQNWQVSVQRDLPGSLQMAATYLGIKGTHGTQDFLPNTYPLGAANPCPSCPTGFAYLISGGNSTRQAAQLQLRRRLHNGLTGILRYTYSKSIDSDAALGGQGPAASDNAQNGTGVVVNVGGPSFGGGTTAALAVAQNWRDLRAERGLSAFDQRHMLSLQMQYTSGMGMRAGTLLSGWKGAIFKEWTVAAQVTAGSGLPQTPIYLAPVQGTGITGTIRPDYTGAPLSAAPAGAFLNPAAYRAPAPGQWGNAGRNSITGPAQFTLNASLGRTFRVSDRLNLDLRADALNALNHVTYTGWNTTVNSAQFGLPGAANSMRSLQITLRLRF
ncbi:MAG: carboxypeptidase regulatory-like domain-containing protein [Bryobacteraceae bacterium]